MNAFLKVFLFSFFYFAQVKVHAEWQVDLSRRQTDFSRVEEVRMPASQMNSKSKEESNAELLATLKGMMNPVEPSLEIAILQTENGFIPSYINVKKNEVYKIHIVNLNSKEKTASFLLDAFSVTQSTVYGVVKTVMIQPKLEGVFDFTSPETGFSGRLVVIDENNKNSKAQQKLKNKKSQESEQLLTKN